MEYKIRQLAEVDFPDILMEIPDSPKQLFVRGTLPSPNTKLLTVVGSRKYTTYGKQVCQKLIEGLRGHDISIVSGLALGIDAIAHQSALDAGLHTIAVPGSGLDDSVIYPRSNAQLAKKILEKGGALFSEFDPMFKAQVWSFPKRNRIMVGMSHATLLIEAGEKSGTLITARLATEYNRELLGVPGSIFSNNSKGVHQFLKLGATVVTESKDILEALGLVQDDTSEQKTLPLNLSEDEEKVFKILSEPKPKDDLVQELGLPITDTNVLLSGMEIKGLIIEEMGVIRIN